MPELIELKLFYDKERTRPIRSDLIEFDPVLTGHSTEQSVFLFNAIRFGMKVDLELSGDNIIILKDVKNIGPKETKELVLKLTPPSKSMEPIRARLKIKIFYLVT